ncbi:MAG: alpha/beta fold hydrolase [Myxococcota bacterium]
MVRWLGRTALALGVVALGAWLAVGVFLYVMQDRLLFPAPGGIGRDALDAAAGEVGAEPITLRADDGVGLYGWWLRGDHGRVVLFFHGNGETVADYAPLYRVLLRAGWDVATVAYRGYPGSDPVAPSEDGMARDAAALWAWAVERYPAERVVVHGRSLGGGVAAILVDGDANPAALVLESTFVSVTALARRIAPVYPVGWLLRNRFETVDRAPRLGVPVLVLHSSDDQVIPLAASAKQLLPIIAEVEYHETSGFDHQSCLPVSDPRMRSAYLAFLDRVVPR